MQNFVDIGWAVGFVDGEGCFSITFIQAPRPSGSTNGLNIQVFHEFVVTQGAKSKSCLDELQRFFGVGQVLANTRKDNHRENLFRFVVRKRSDLLRNIIPFFEHYPLRTAKQSDFVMFSRCLGLVNSGAHLSRDGLLAVIEIAERMNQCKPRRALRAVIEHRSAKLPVSELRLAAQSSDSASVLGLCSAATITTRGGASTDHVHSSRGKCDWPYAGS